MNLPDDLLYAKTHEWLRKNEDGSFSLGITEHAQEELGDLVYIGLPEAGAHFSAGDAIAEVESVKAVSSIYTPLSGTVTEVNSELSDSPELVNTAPYEAWFVRLSGELSGGLMDAEEYEAFVAENG